MTAPRATLCVILAAGMGTRMKSATPKVMHELAGQPMVAHVRGLCDALGAERVAVVIAREPEFKAVVEAAAPARAYIQHPQAGTAHAVRAAEAEFAEFEGDVFVLYGADPLVKPETLLAMKSALGAGAGVAVLGFRPPEPGLYGRLIRDASGGLDRIVEAKEASLEELAEPLCNAGVMAFDARLGRELLPQISNDNAKGEFYLTDLVGLARARGTPCAVVECADPLEALGVDSREQLAAAEAVMQSRLRAAAMAEGVTLIAPETVFLSADAIIERDVVIEPFVHIGRNVRIRSGARIRSHSRLEGVEKGPDDPPVEIAGGAQIGPFARLRPGAQIGEKARVGNFVEMKNAALGAGAKASHLTYLGDATVGADANIGAGTITCNYDGYDKAETHIGAGAFIGSNSALVAPAKIGAGAIIGAGSVITRPVEVDALALGRGEQNAKPGWAARFRALKEAAKKPRK